MTAVIAFVLRYWRLILVLLAFALTFGAGWKLAGARWQVEIAQLQEDYADAAADATARYREIERSSQQRVDIAEANHVERMHKIEARLAVAVAAGNRLRDALSAANHRTAPDPVAARAIDDPFILRELLGNLDALAGMCAQEVDQARAQISGLHAYIGAITAE